MGKKLLFLAVLALFSIGVNAQEWGPIEKADAVTGHIYKIRNVQAGELEGNEYQYLAGGASWYSWATSTVLATEANSLSFKLTETEQGWTLTRTTDSKYTFISGGSPGTGHEGWGEMHVDQGSQSALLHFFTFVKQESGYYHIQAAPADTLYYDAEKWWGWEIYTDEKGNEYVENAVYPTVSDETVFGLDWELLDYTVYNEAVKLGELIEEAKASEYAEALATDIAAAELVYNNTSSTSEELSNAYTTLKVKINYASLAGASADNPKDATHLLVNNDFSAGNITGWTCTFVSGTNATNVGYQSASYTNGDITISQFIEAWAADGTSFNKNCNHRAIGDGKLSQLMPSLPAGKYSFTCDAIASYQDDADVEVKGVELFVSDGATEDKRVIAVHTGNGVPEHYKAVFINAGGDVELGLRTNDTDANWICADNFTLTYYGETTDTPEKIFLDEAIEKCEEAIPDAEEVYAKADLKEAYITALNNAKEATQDYATYQTALEEAFAPFQSSVNAYNKYLDKVHELQSDIAETEYTAPEIGTLSDYLMDDNEMEPSEEMPNGSYCYIINNALLDDAQIEAEILWLTDLFQKVVTNSLKEGDDCTKMLVNANFSDANGKGWTKGGNCTNITWTGGWIPSEEGSIGCPVAESYHSTFDIYQVVENAPNGVYALSLNGFCRLDGDEAKVPAEIYMGNFATSLMGLQDGAIPTEEAEDGVNAYLTTFASAGNDCPTLQNPIFTGCKRQSPYDGADVQSADGLGYVPNGMEGASVAFSAGRYKATVYGLVTDGKMTLGVRNLTSSTVWALWGNFKLIYVGKSNEAFQIVIGNYKTKLQEYIDENSENMTQPALDDANAAITKANTATTAEEANDALIDLNTQLVATAANVEAVTAFKAELETINTVIENNPEADISSYEALVDRIDDYASLTTEEVNALVEDMKASEKDIKWSSLVNVVAKATVDDPADITSLVLTNPGFESQLTGWTNDGSISFQAQSNTSFAKTDTYYAEKWHASGTLDMNQTITLPAGSYILTADCYTQTADAVLYAGDNQTEIPATEDALVQASYSVAFAVGETTEVKIGNKATLTTSTWNCVDNFTLVATGNDPTAITSVDNAKTTTVSSIFNLAGQKLSAPQKGINIVDGKKVLVK